jgi:hypothetical protein
VNNGVVRTTDRVSIPGQVKRAYFHQSSEKAMCSVLNGGPVPWLKRSDRETDLSPLSGSDVKRVQLCI